MKTQALIVAAGRGTRLGANEPKALIPLHARPMLAYSIRAFRNTGIETPLVTTIPPECAPDFGAVFRQYDPLQNWRCVPGGAERQDSVRAGLDALDEDTDIVAVHDAARPFIEPDAIRNAIREAERTGAATVAIPSVDTILVATPDYKIADVPERSTLWMCQTPQVFRVDWLREAHAHAFANRVQATDDSRLVWSLGHPVRIVQGSPTNRKITTPDDVVWAERYAAGVTL
jgi:2-C-methyl-D-erythritol 4-phosphate cytidylyltransferase